MQKGIDAELPENLGITETRCFPSEPQREIIFHGLYVQGADVLRKRRAGESREKNKQEQLEAPDQATITVTMH